MSDQVTLVRFMWCAMCAVVFQDVWLKLIVLMLIVPHGDHASSLHVAFSFAVDYNEHNYNYDDVHKIILIIILCCPL